MAVGTLLPAQSPVTAGGYLYELQDTLRKRTYFKQTTIQNDEMLPRRVCAIWSPDGRYVAVDLYYGRIAYWVIVIDTSTPVPRDTLVEDILGSRYANYLTTADRWRDNTHLEIIAFRPVQWGGKPPFEEKSLTIHFIKGGAKFSTTK